MQPSGLHKRVQNPAELWWLGHAGREDQSTAAILNTEARSGRYQRSVYELYAEMEIKDGHLYSVLQTRLNGLLGLRRRALPAAPANEAARNAAELVHGLIERIPRFQQLLGTLLTALSRGFAVVELVWGYDSAGRITVVDWVPHVQEEVAFSPNGQLLLLSPPFDAGGLGSSVSEMASGVRAFPAPDRKFLVLRFQADSRNPYGRGLNQHAYWYYWFKKNTLKFWSVYNERYGAPTAVARYGAETSAEDRVRLREVIDTLQADSGVVVPETIQLQLLESTRGNGGGSYKDFLDWCNDEISKVVLGATLTSSEGRRSGSLALGSVHQMVRQDYIDSDARLLESLLNETLVAWLCEANMGTGVVHPSIQIDTESPQDLGACISVDRALLSLGVTLPLSYFHERYGRPAPVESDTPLRYDDANFYQYHLQYGILTINEVRERLNLPPVSWGNRPPLLPSADIQPDIRSAEDGGRPVR